MKDDCFTKWIPDDNVVDVYDMDTIGWREGKFVLSLIPDNLDHDKRSEYNVELIWDDIFCYQVTQETYRPDVWIAAEDEAWTFYVSKSSKYLQNFKKDNMLVPETVYHFLVGGTNFIIDILSIEYPTIRFVK